MLAWCTVNDLPLHRVANGLSMFLLEATSIRDVPDSICLMISILKTKLYCFLHFLTLTASRDGETSALLTSLLNFQSYLRLIGIIRKWMSPCGKHWQSLPRLESVVTWITFVNLWWPSYKMCTRNIDKTNSVVKFLPKTVPKQPKLVFWHYYHMHYCIRQYLT